MDILKIITSLNALPVLAYTGFSKTRKTLERGAFFHPPEASVLKLVLELVLELFWSCFGAGFGAVLELFLSCSGAVFDLFWNCFIDVSSMFDLCFIDV